MMFSGQVDQDSQEILNKPSESCVWTQVDTLPSRFNPAAKAKTPGRSQFLRPLLEELPDASCHRVS